MYTPELLVLHVDNVRRAREHVELHVDVLERLPESVEGAGLVEEPIV